MRLSRLTYDQLSRLSVRIEGKRDREKKKSDPWYRMGWMKDRLSVELNYKAFYGGKYDRFL